jgi:hypothetical protein
VVEAAAIEVFVSAARARELSEYARAASWNASQAERRS